MSALQLLDKKDLECSICLERFTEPKTLECLHSYCLHCLQHLMETHGNIRCPKCCQTYDKLNKDDLEGLTSNQMISNLVEYLEKIESEKPATCSTCDNQPQYNCSECQLYMCGQCIKHHKILPALKDHPLYTLDKNEDGKEDWKSCPTHSDHMLEFYCPTCYKCGCKKCEHVLFCYQNKHDYIPMQTAVDEFNQNATEVKKTADEIKSKLKGTLDTISQNTSDFESQLRLCRTTIEIQEKTIIKKVQENCKAMIEDLEKMHKEKNEIADSQIKNIDSKLTKVNTMVTSIDKMMNKPEETETLGNYKTTINAVKVEVFGVDFDQLFLKKNITPTFIPSTQLDDVLTEGIGKITNADCVFEIAKEDKLVTVKKGQPFVMKISSLTKSDTCQLAATLRNTSAEESATEVDYQGSGEYSIKGRCNEEGDWQMEITSGVAHIKGSPVNVTVEPVGLVHTIGNIQDYKEHDKENKVTDVMLDTDGCLLVSSFSKDILKFNQSGSFVARIQVPQDTQVVDMHQLDDGHMVYSDALTQCVVMCDDKFQEISSFGKGILKYTDGFTVKKETRVLYVADRKAHCVFKFNIDDGKLLGKIGSEGSGEGQFNNPMDVTLTKEGHVIVTDFKNNRIQMFDIHDKFMKILVSEGEDGKVRGPCGVTIDAEENILVTSNHKLQLFDKNGVFIKRIDDIDDGLDVPVGICVISNRPRRVAVANYRANNVKIFNY